VIKMVGEEFDKLSGRGHPVGQSAWRPPILTSSDRRATRAIKKRRDRSEALAQGCARRGHSGGGTMLGFGVKFEGAVARWPAKRSRVPGQSSTYVDDKSYVVWPRARHSAKPCCRCRRLDQATSRRPQHTERDTACLSSRGWSSVSAASRPSATCRSRSIREILGLMRSATAPRTTSKCVDGPPSAGTIASRAAEDPGLPPHRTDQAENLALIDLERHVADGRERRNA